MTGCKEQSTQCTPGTQSLCNNDIPQLIPLCTRVCVCDALELRLSVENVLSVWCVRVIDGMGTLPLREGQKIQFMFALKVAHECNGWMCETTCNHSAILLWTGGGLNIKCICNTLLSLVFFIETQKKNSCKLCLVV